MAVFVGTSGNDTLTGTNRSDDINGKAGDDELIGLARADEIKGGLGDDSLDGGLGNDSLRGGLGNDSIQGGFGEDVLRGGAGDDLLLGGFGNDFLLGNFGDDTLDSGPGSDVMRGGEGSDTFVLRAFEDPTAALASTTYPEEPPEEEPPHECPPIDHECPYPEPRDPSSDVDVVLDFEWRTDAIAVQPGRVADIVVGDFDGDDDLDATVILDDGSRTIFLNANEQQVAAAFVEESAIL